MFRKRVILEKHKLCNMIWIEKLVIRYTIDIENGITRSPANDVMSRFTISAFSNDFGWEKFILRF